MSVQDALKTFEANNRNMMESLRKLQEEVKKETSLQVQNYMLGDEFEKANKMMKSLEGLIRLDLKSNAHVISDSVYSLFHEFDMNMEESSNKTFAPSNAKKDELSQYENELIEEIGYSSASKLTELKKTTESNSIHKLEEKGYLTCETVKWADEEILMFELSNKGKDYFKEKYGLEPIYKKDSHPFCTINDLELQLRLSGYEILESNNKMIEVKMDNKSCYMMLSEQIIEQQLDEYSYLKNIGFVCKDDRLAELAYEKTKDWTNLNKEKSKYLTIHFTTLEKLTSSQDNPFKTVLC